MAVHFDCCESDGEVESVVKTLVLNFCYFGASDKTLPHFVS